MARAVCGDELVCAVSVDHQAVDAAGGWRTALNLARTV
jgi:hypothetical protein